MINASLLGHEKRRQKRRVDSGDRLSSKMLVIDAAVDCKANGTGATAPSVILMIESELFRTRIQDDLRASRTRACA